MNYLPNDKGRPSMTATLVVLTFGLTALLAVSAVVLKAVGLPAVDLPSTASLLVPVLTLYWGRRHTESQQDGH